MVVNVFSWQPRTAQWLDGATNPAATLNVHSMNFFGELYILIDDIILNYGSITYDAMFAVLMAVVGMEPSWGSS